MVEPGSREYFLIRRRFRPGPSPYGDTPSAGYAVAGYAAPADDALHRLPGYEDYEDVPDAIYGPVRGGALDRVARTDLAGQYEHKGLDGQGANNVTVSSRTAAEFTWFDRTNSDPASGQRQEGTTSTPPGADQMRGERYAPDREWPGDPGDRDGRDDDGVDEDLDDDPDGSWTDDLDAERDRLQRAVTVVSKHLPEGAPAADELVDILARMRPGAVLRVIGVDGTVLAEIPVSGERRHGRHGRRTWRGGKRSQLLREARQRAEHAAAVRDLEMRERAVRQAAAKAEATWGAAQREHDQMQTWLREPQARAAAAPAAQAEARKLFPVPTQAGTVKAGPGQVSGQLNEATIKRVLPDAEPWTDEHAEPWTKEDADAAEVGNLSRSYAAKVGSEVQFAWASYLIGDELDLFATQLSALIEEMRETTAKGGEVSYSALDGFARGWQATAGVWRNRELLRRVLHPSVPGDWGPVRKPLPG